MYSKKRSSLLLTTYLLLSCVTPSQAQDVETNTSPQNPSSAQVQSTDKFNSSGNPLLFPTKTQEVEIEEQQPVTLNQAIEIALNNNKDLEVARLQLDNPEIV